jgi:hypothetical protein
MPGVGFLLGGAIAAIFDPRASYAVAGAGVLVVLAGAALVMRRVDWTPELAQGKLQNGASSVAEGGSSRTALTRP